MSELELAVLYVVRTFGVDQGLPDDAIHGLVLRSGQPSVPDATLEDVVEARRRLVDSGLIKEVRGGGWAAA